MIDPLLDLGHRASKEAREDRDLAPFASHSAASAGRRFPEPEDPLRTAWERDRDRIVHCTAFRRLMYKTQVFVNHEGDHNRTRLSHTLEVAQVARSIATALRINETLTETIALAHDLGHPPFGHRGERVLNELLVEHGGFRHNAQALRIVDLLERRSPEYAGLNLTQEVRESLLKHEKGEVWPEDLQPKRRQPSLEAQVVDLADSTAYHMHDLEDGLLANMFSEASLRAECELWRMAEAAVEARHPGFLGETRDRKLRVKRVANELIKICITDLINETRCRLNALAPDSSAAIREHERRLVGHGTELHGPVGELHAWLYRNFYRHTHLKRFSAWTRKLLAELMPVYLEHPDEMAPWYRAWAREIGISRAACDYIAGMTDRFAEAEHSRLSKS